MFVWDSRLRALWQAAGDHEHLGTVPEKLSRNTTEAGPFGAQILATEPVVVGQLSQPGPIDAFTRQVKFSIAAVKFCSTF